MRKEQIEWKDLPHNSQLGHGREGLILKLNDCEAIKVYSPQDVDAAEREYNNSARLKDAGFYVPEPKRLVNVNINRQTVRLPGKCEIMGIGLFKHRGIESVPGLIREYIHGEPYSTKKPKIKDIKGLLGFLDQLHEKGFTFSDGVISDYLSTEQGTALVDCSTLMDESDCRKNFRGGFNSISAFYKRYLINDWKSETQCHHSMGFLLKMFVTDRKALKEYF